MTSVPPDNIKLDPKDWYWATWRDLPPLPRPEPPPFDEGEARERVRQFIQKCWLGHWHHLKIPPVMSRPEAHFWLTVITRAVELGWLQGRQEESADKITAGRFDGTLSLDQAMTLLKPNRLWQYPPVLMACLGRLFPLAELALPLNDRCKDFPGRTLADGLRTFIIPYLTPEEKQSCRDAVRAAVSVAVVPGPFGIIKESFLLHVAGAIGGFGPQLNTLLDSTPAGFWSQAVRFPDNLTPVIFGLHDPALVERHVRRMNLWLYNQDHARAWLAHTETRALDWLTASIRKPDRCKTPEVFKVMTLVKDPVVAPHVLALSRDSQVAAKAAEWLSKNIALATAGVSPLAADPARGPLSEQALQLLRNFKLQGREAALREVFAALDPVQQAYLQAEVLDYHDDTPAPFTDETTPAWLLDSVTQAKTLKRVRPASWADLSSLPPVRVEDHSLNADQRAALLIALSKSTFEAPQPLVAALKVHAEPVSLEAFAWTLMEQWLERGAPPGDKWAVSAVGLLGGDASALKLTRYVVEWPFSRAALALGALQAIGTDTAFMQLNTIATSKIAASLRRKKANEAVQAIAQARGLTREGLADRIVPTCGLDANGQRVFDYGGRNFTVVLNADLKPVIRDEAGKLRPDLPAPGARDDENLALPAYQTWKTLKKQVQTVAKAQASRLEKAMLVRRQWLPDEFRSCLVDHPLMTNLARLLIWGGYDQDGALRRVFRVTDERDYADVEDEVLRLDDVARIGLLHPVELSEDEKARWQQTLYDYTLVQPFGQLQRSAYRLTPEERAAWAITRFSGKEVAKLVLNAVLKNLNWRHLTLKDIDGTRQAGQGTTTPGNISQILQKLLGVEQQPDQTFAYGKEIRSAGVMAILEHSGSSIYDWRDEPIQLQRLYFLPLENMDANSEELSALPLAGVDPVIVSETLRDIHIAVRRSEEQQKGK